MTGKSGMSLRSWGRWSRQEMTDTMYEFLRATGRNGHLADWALTGARAKFPAHMRPTTFDREGWARKTARRPVQGGADFPGLSGIGITLKNIQTWSRIIP